MLSRLLAPKKLLNSSPIYKVQRRFSGHDAMDITPSQFAWNKAKDSLHFFTLLAVIPAAIITTITNIRGNPELSEIPEGYEPRHWEYYRIPLTRWIAKWFFRTEELEYEIEIAQHELDAEEFILRKSQERIEKVMAFYTDHRSRNFRPVYAEYMRRGRDEALTVMSSITTEDSDAFDREYDPARYTHIPTEGYRPTDLDKINL